MFSKEAHPRTGRRRLSLGTAAFSVAVAASLVVTGPAFAAAGALDSSFGEGGKVISPWASGVSFTANATEALPDGKILVAGVASGQFALTRHLRNGALDTKTFGTGGRTVVDFPSGMSTARGLARQSDGKVVVVGDTNGDFAIARITKDGLLDSTFGTGGKVIVSNPASVESAAAVAIQPDGKIVVAGSSVSEFVAVRLLSNGALDSSFGAQGRAVLTVYDPARVSGIALQADGKIVLAGGMAPCGSGTQLCYALFLANPLGLAVARFTANGLVDSTFGEGGSIYWTPPVTIGMTRTEATSVVSLPDGKLLLAGYATIQSSTETDGLVLKLNSNGSLDASFGTNGASFVHNGAVDDFKAIALQGDGKILLAGTSRLGGYGTDGDFLAARMLSDGTMDTTFGTGGVVVTDFNGLDDVGNAASISPKDQKFVVAGSTASSYGTDIALIRLLVS